MIRKGFAYMACRLSNAPSCAPCGAALTLLVSADGAAPRLAGRLEATLVEKGP